MVTTPRPAVTLRQFAVALAFATAGCLGACTPGDDAGGGSAVTPEASVRNGATLDAEEFAARVERDGTVVVDVRTPEEYASGHLPDAVNIDINGADFADRVAELDPDTTYAVYCRSGNRSAQALQVMLDADFTDVAHLDGGIGAWQSAGRHIVTGP